VPELSDIESLLKAFATVAVVSVAVAVCLRLVRPRRSLLPPQRWRAVPWTGWHCALACLALIVLPEIVAAGLGLVSVHGWPVQQPAEPKTVKRLISLASGLVALPLVILAWWAIVGGPRISRIRFDASNWRRNTVLGVAGWLFFGPVAYLVNFVALLVYGALYGSQPPDHPLLDLLRHEAPARTATALVLLESLIAAPIREELLFRGILQPWLCRHPQGGALGLAWAALLGIAFRSMTVTTSGLDRWLSLAAPVLLVAAAASVAWYVSEQIAQPNPPQMLRWLAPLTDPERRRRAVLGLFGTATMFANLHAVVWPTPIPLLVLGLGLGWLALRTQGVVAPVVSHALFNAVACVDMFFQMPRAG
jgi:membrane protease YdiL (CAAX protease family)